MEECLVGFSLHLASSNQQWRPRRKAPCGASPPSLWCCCCCRCRRRRRRRLASRNATGPAATTPAAASPPAAPEATARIARRANLKGAACPLASDAVTAPNEIWAGLLSVHPAARPGPAHACIRPNRPATRDRRWLASCLRFTVG
ncbi:hypothetical protein BRADI_3g03403v3 [Brachypodium distachyon]|uniref:Uncharacterized protein n=1 Tax=Brachypodium distachyon TaxID=15368 RepID=A0A2K2CUX5_BRADI|nr:hypothetical protein BRADI_3g03403v3 [Brachypodium distachyon]